MFYRRVLCAGVALKCAEENDATSPDPAKR